MSIRSLATEFHKHENTVKRLMSENGITNPDASELREILAAVQKPTIKGEKARSDGVDPKSGLSWFQARQRQDTLRMERENRLADQIIDEKWMEVTEHETAFSTLMARLEQIPSTIKSKLSLPESAEKDIQRIIDEARRDADELVKLALKKKSAELRALSAPRHD